LWRLLMEEERLMFGSEYMYRMHERVERRVFVNK
jgi:hypothetical protein